MVLACFCVGAIYKTFLPDGNTFLGETVTATIDRSIGSKHPIYNYTFTSNYGFIAGTIAADNYELDAYVLGIKNPVTKFTGRCIAYIRRLHEDNDRLIIVPEGVELTDEEIQDAVYFQEQYSPFEIVRQD